MNALTSPVPIKDEVWYLEDGKWLTRTPGKYDHDSPIIFPSRPGTLERARRWADCVTSWAGVDDPIAELSRLRQIEARWNAVHDAQARTVALLGDGIGSVLPDHADASRAAQAYEDTQRGPAPWIVVECWPKPSLFLSASGNWAGSPTKAMPHLRYEDAVDRMRVWGGEVVSLERVVAEMEVVP